MLKLILVFVISVTNVAPSLYPFVCPIEDIVSINQGKCIPSNPNCLYPNPYDCNSFIQCVPQNDWSGKPYVMQCAPSNPKLQWNDAIKQCDWPNQLLCPISSTSPLTTTTTTPSTTVAVTTESPSSTPSSGFVCPEEDSSTCKTSYPNWLYPNPDDCFSYIYCVPQSNGTVISVIVECPLKLEWNDNKKRCDWKNFSTCPSESTPPADTTTTSTPTTTIFEFENV